MVPQLSEPDGVDCGFELALGRFTESGRRRFELNFEAPLGTSGVIMLPNLLSSISTGSTDTRGGPNGNVGLDEMNLNVVLPSGT